LPLINTAVNRRITLAETDQLLEHLANGIPPRHLSGSPVAMRFSAVLVAFLSTADGLSIFGGRNQAVVADDDLKIPGESPLELCPKEHDNDIIKIQSVDLLPNPPQA